jgi:hypothetical protein
MGNSCRRLLPPAVVRISTTLFLSCPWGAALGDPLHLLYVLRHPIVESLVHLTTPFPLAQLLRSAMAREQEVRETVRQKKRDNTDIYYAKTLALGDIVSSDNFY